MEEIIKTHDLCKSFGAQKALKNVNITVKSGDIYGLVGNNGAGKTTLLRILTGQSQQTSGEFQLCSKYSQKDIERARKNIGAIIESPCFYPNLTVKENMEYYRIQRGIPDKSKVLYYLEQVKLSNALNKKFKDLSLGMKQRLGLALSLMSEPELLILDEPINGLDPSGIREIRNLLIKLNKEKNITIIISSHILSELSNIATCYGFLSKGVLVEELSFQELNEKCKSYAKIKVKNPKKLTVLLEDKLSYKDFRVMSDDTIEIYDKNRNSEEISSLVVNNGIGLISLVEQRITLENYYLSLVGGECNA